MPSGNLRPPLPITVRSLLRLQRLAVAACVVATAVLADAGASAAQPVPGERDARPFALVHAHVAANAGKSGVYVLDAAEEALLARAWLADHARESIDVQYFIWSTDNVGILAAEALLRAAERGVRVRVIVDDLLIDAPDRTLLALARHPNIDIRIYNPRNSVGVPLQTRLFNVVTDFRGVNQRMHDKTLVVDGIVAITGGRNMASEYFDYNQRFNFRDRDALLFGAVVRDVTANFDRFWASRHSVRVEELYDGIGLMQKSVAVDDAQIAAVYRDLHAYALSPQNFAPLVRAAIGDTPRAFERIARETVWGRVEFISDRPGKNERRLGLGGGGDSTRVLAALVEAARDRVVIQSPYLVLSDEALALFGRAVARGVKVRINTNSMAATDNLLAFSGYRNQRARMLQMGLQIREYRPDPQLQRSRMQASIAARSEAPIFSLHAKSMVVDGQIVYIGTFNLDPRSQNLNTEVGAIVHDASVAMSVERQIDADMAAGNSWDAATDEPDQYAPLVKRGQVRLLQLLPLRPVL